MSGLARKGPSLVIGALAAAVALAAPAFATADPAADPAAAHGRAAAAHAAAPTLAQVSSDPYTDAQAQHATEVEPDTFSSGSTVVSAFQVGRVSSGGASNIGWATSGDGGKTWTHGYMPGTTANTGGPYATTSDASVAYDAKDGVWMVSWLGITSGNNVDVMLSRSTDGGLTWGNPVAVSTGASYDKNWTVCDDHASSPYYGHCYTEYDDAGAGDIEHMRTSTDGGQTWGAELGPSDNPSGLGGQPVVQPSGTVIVPFSSASSNAEDAFTSSDGGASWGASVQIATVSHHTVSGLDDEAASSDIAKQTSPHDTLRESPLPSAAIDASGKVYTVWSDCTFRSGCSSNDIVMSTSTDGTSWSAPVRVPIDAVSSTADHFTPGIGIDPTSAGSTARIGLTYYYYPNANCTDTTCQLDAGYVSSTDGGTTWTAPVQLAGPMTLAWLPNTDQGRMFGDYIATSVLAGGNAVTVIPVAQAPSGSTFSMAMDAPVGGLPVGGSATGNTVTVSNPGSQTSTVGSAVSLQVSGTDSGGAALTYTAAGLPAGLSISSTGLISGTPTTAGTSTVTVTATDSTGASGSATFSWTVNSTTGGGCTKPGQLLANPGFETGTAAPWSMTSGVLNNDTVDEPAHSGNWDAWLDGYGAAHTDTVSQSVAIPSGCSAAFTFWLHVDSGRTGTTAVDTLKVQVLNSSGTVLSTLATYSNLNAGNGYTQDSFNVNSYAGQTVTLKFTGVEKAGAQTSFVLDDTALNAS
ncbi:putative Ig domain-containing protein [Streptacidiphilus fuscans]|uniref:Exo-alpha-sialidase n=1 Tax=Streptacidiphilus fuscans TaxID=2789292 RepID=A0A931B7X7_9ACTN|nr:putative Ig domain-containing protein [Streptacidiphilus fuscans]MBF9072764.1 exo-alpha-sialidase [Streptacidiphilus fuscans]